MDSSLVQPARLIEYPNDLSGCDFIDLGQKHLLYMCSHSEGGTPFIVVLGFYAGQKEDIITKDLIQPVDDASRRSIKEVLSRVLAPEYWNASVLFL